LKAKHNGSYGRDKHKSNHHIVPTSRGGPSGNGSKIFWNKFPWRRTKHVAWHALFHNYLPSEAIWIIQKSWTRPDGTLNASILGVPLYEAWLEVFSVSSPEEAVSFIKAYFIPAETRFREGMKVSL